jgi:hypothetical protein
MKEKNERTRFYVAMGSRWAQVSGSEEEISALLKSLSWTRPVFGKDGVHIIYIN